MKTLDILLLLPLFFGAFRGFRKGLLLEIVSMIGVILAIVGGFKFLHFGVSLLSEYMETYNKAIPYIAFVLIFVGIILAVNLLGIAMKKVLDFTLLGGIDSLAGALLGILKWAFAVSVCLWLAATVGIEIPFEMTADTVIYPFLLAFAPGVVEVAAQFLPNLQHSFKAISDLFSDTKA